MTVTSKKIAELANVSRGTVDRALHNRGGINPEVSARIKKIAKELGYSPNIAASALSRSQNNIHIGVLIPSNSAVFFDDVKTGLLTCQEEFNNYGLYLDIVQTNGCNETTQLEAIKEMEQKGMKGLLIAPINTENIKNKIIELTEKKIPVITIGTDIENSKRLCYVGHNYYQSGETAAGMMSIITNQKSNVAIITGSKNILSNNLRIEGFLHNIKKFNHDIKIIEVSENNDDDIDSYLATLRLFKTYNNIDALYITSSGVYGIIKALKELTLDKKIHIIAINDLPRTLEYVIEGIITSTICQSAFDQGYIALKLMFNYLLKNEYPNQDRYYTKIDIKIRENISSNH